MEKDGQNQSHWDSARPYRSPPKERTGLPKLCRSRLARWETDLSKLPNLRVYSSPLMTAGLIPSMLLTSSRTRWERTVLTIPCTELLGITGYSRKNECKVQ